MSLEFIYGQFKNDIENILQTDVKAIIFKITEDRPFYHIATKDSQNILSLVDGNNSGLIEKTKKIHTTFELFLKKITSFLDMKELDFLSISHNSHNEVEIKVVPKIAVKEFSFNNEGKQLILTVEDGPNYERNVTVSWEHWGKQDRTYRIYRSLKPEGPFELLDSYRTNKFFDEDVSKDAYYYYVAEVDVHGNEIFKSNINKIYV
jgi:hypothetical protein